MPRVRVHSKGFTLVELLVVIGIIGLLIAILVPTLSVARQSARRESCKSNLRQIGTAFEAYKNTNRGRYPLAPGLPSVNPNNYPLMQDTLAGMIQNNKKIFECPGDTTVYPTENISYLYYVQLGVRPIKQTFIYKVMGNASDTYVLYDADDFHKGIANMNWLFVDGSVRSGFATKPNKVEDDDDGK